MRTCWTFHGPGQLVFGRDAVRRLADAVTVLAVRRAMLITDRQLTEAAVADRVIEHIGRAGVGVNVFADCRENAPIDVVLSALDQARKAKPDVLVGLGGGSTMDTAKAVAVLLAHNGTCQDYAGDQRVPGPIFPLILIPTTAGTGSEVTAAAVLCDEAQGTKFAILSNHLRPRIAVVDPLLTVTCPPHVTADSGIDALTHAIEAYMAVDNEEFPLPEGEQTVYQGRHPLGDLMAQRAIELIGGHLRRAVADGSDLEAREAMSLAATLAGLAFSNVGVALVHALEYVVAPIAHIPHGRGCGLLLPYVMRFNQPVRRAQLTRIAQLLGEDVSGLDADAAADRAIEAVQRLRARIGIPHRLSDVGVQPQDIGPMAEKAVQLKRILRVNPRSATLADLESVLHAAL